MQQVSGIGRQTWLVLFAGICQLSLPSGWAQTGDPAPATQQALQIWRDLGATITQTQNQGFSIKLENGRPTNEAMQAVVDIPDLSEVILQNCQLEGISFAPLSQSSKLIDLAISSSNLTNSQWHEIGQCTNLQRLTLPKGSISRNNILALKKLNKLEHVNINKEDLDNHVILGLAEVGLLHTFKELIFLDQPVAEDKLITFFWYASLSDISIITIDLLEFLPNLQRMDCDPQQITDELLFYLREHGKLHVLPIARDEANKRITNDSEITRIDLQNTKVTSQGLRVLRSLPNLKAVDLTGLKIQNDDLRVLAWQPNIEELNLTNTPITDAGIPHLSLLPNLHRLILVGTEITDAAFPSLQRLPKLASLGIYNTKITLDQLDQLAGFPNLHRVNFSRLTDELLLTLAGLDRLHWVLLFGKIPGQPIQPPQTDAEVKDLVLHDAKITYVGYAVFRKTQNIEKIFAMELDISDQSLALLPQFKNLKQLVLYKCPQIDQPLRFINQVEQLQQLQLIDHSLADEHDALGHLPKSLQELSLVNCNLSDESVKCIGALPEL